MLGQCLIIVICYFIGGSIHSLHKASSTSSSDNGDREWFTLHGPSVMR